MKNLLLCLLLFLSISTITVAQTKSSEKFSGLGFYEFSYDSEEGKIVSNQFEFHRIYFTYENALSDELAYKFQI